MNDNPKDPMIKSSPDRQRELFKQFSAVANGFSAEEVLGAAANMFVNALRQAHATQRGALDSLDRLTAQTKNLLASHYDAMGKRRNVFPFHQVLEATHFDDREKFQKK
jgi:hypothetical protein